MFAFFTAVNNLSGLLRKQVYFKGFERSLFVIDGFQSVIIEKHNNFVKAAFELQSSHVLEKHRKAWTVCSTSFSTFFQFTCPKLIVNSCIKHKTCYVNHL